MNKSFIFILFDFVFLALAIYYAIAERGTISGWFWTISAVAWSALLVNAFFFEKST